MNPRTRNRLLRNLAANSSPATAKKLRRYTLGSPARWLWRRELAGVCGMNSQGGLFTNARRLP